MFEAEALERVVSLQQKSYTLLRWVGDSLQSGTLNFNTVHTSMALPDAAREWIGRNLGNFPGDARPDRADLEPFAHLFASYLETSFVLVAQPGQQLISSHGHCYCGFCSYLVSAKHLKVRTPSKKAHQKARQMKDLYLSSLAADAGIPFAYAVTDKLLSDPVLAEHIAFATYGRELLRRSEFASQGEGILVLWREIAWDEKGRLKKNFALSAARILQAEAAILDALRQPLY